MELNYTQRLLMQSLAVLTVLRWIMAGLHDISPEEAQLMEAIRHPAVVGINGGQLTAWFAGIGTVFLGDTALGVRFLAPLLAEKQLLPILDLAYQGLGKGMAEDAYGVRRVLAEVPEALIAYSCDKNFGMYRDRVGAIYVMAETAEVLNRVLSNGHALARAAWSMPPDHGGAAVRLILEDPSLTAMWLDELDTMRTRMNQVRARLAEAGQQARRAVAAALRVLRAVLVVAGFALLAPFAGVIVAGALLGLLFAASGAVVLLKLAPMPPLPSARSITSASASVRWNGARRRDSTIARAMRRASGSPPCRHRRCGHCARCRHPASGRWRQ